MSKRSLRFVPILTSALSFGCAADKGSSPKDASAPDAAQMPSGGATDARAGGSTGHDAAAASRAAPHITSDFWTVAHNPDLGDATSPNQQVVDFGVWQANDGTWQLWSCIRGTLIGGNSRLFYHWEGRNLTDPDWAPKGIAMQADPSLGEAVGGLQAPYVIRLGDVWHLFYGDWEHICHATSTDGKSFTRVVGSDGKTGMFTEGIGLYTRDPMLLHEGTTNYLYYTTSEGADYVRTSSDLMVFGPSVRIAYGGVAGTGGSSAECPFVVHPDSFGPYFLFRTAVYGVGATTHVYRSADAKNFGIDDDAHFLVATLPIAAPEIVRVGADYYIAALREDLAGIQIAHLAFTP
jgi:hypothetical protein